MQRVQYSKERSNYEVRILRAFITSIGEPTTFLCKWALERNGFDVVLIQGETSLLEKLDIIYNYGDEDFIRVDADTIVNHNCTEKNIKKILSEDYLKNAWWVQFKTFCWFSVDITHGGVQFYKKEALPFLRKSVEKFEGIDRPETQLSRIHQFYNPRRFETNDTIMGLNGYGIKDLKPAIQLKASRGQSANYDFELAQRLYELS